MMNKINYQKKFPNLPTAQDQEIIDVQNSAMALLKQRKMVYNAFDSAISLLPSQVQENHADQKNQMIIITNNPTELNIRLTVINI